MDFFHAPVAPGARLLIRGQEFVLLRADRTQFGSYILKVRGLSSLVRDQDWQFLHDRRHKSIRHGIDEYEKVDPKKTRLVHDDSPGYASARLHTESLLRTTPPPSNRFCISAIGERWTICCISDYPHALPCNNPDLVS